MFRLAPKKSANLWDLQAVLATLHFPGLPARIDATPMSQKWALQKSPLESQVLAHHLRGIGGDGIVYDSQKDADGKVLAFFLKDDAAAHRDFNAVEEVAA